MHDGDSPRWSLAHAWMVLLSVGFLSAACNDSSRPTSPSSDSALRGSWAGGITERAGEGRIRLSIEESAATDASILVGSWQVEFGDPARTASGSVSGTRTGSRVVLTLGPSPSGTCARPFAPSPVGGYSMNLTLAAGELTGGTEYLGCAEIVQGTVSLRRE